MNLTDNDSFDNVYQLETTDKVLGGALPVGISNQQAQALANRTLWLKNRLGITNRLAGMAILTATVTLDIAAAGVMQAVKGNNATITITLPDPTTLLPNAIIPIMAYNVNKSQVTISGNIMDSVIVVPAIYLDENESVIFIADGSSWRLWPVRYNAANTGEVTHSYKILPGTLSLSGQMLNRADYPRLWKYANGNDFVTSDIGWVNNIAYQGMFSSGNGSTTFRLPDLRGQFIRGFDNGRGLDLYRSPAAIGGYESDDNKQHSHPMNGNNKPNADGEGGILVGTFTGFETINDINTSGSITKRTVEFSGSEARPKNIGLIPLIKK